MRSFENITTNSENDDTNNNETNAENIKSSVEKLPKPVYYVESPDDNTVLIGIDVSIERYKKGTESATVIDWYDTSHERRMLADEIRQKDEYFAFKRAKQEGGGFYYFSPMNLEIYNSKVKNLLGTDKDFSDEEDLIKAFLDSRGNDA